MDFRALLMAVKICQIFHRLYDKVNKNKNSHKLLLGTHQMYSCRYLWLSNLGTSRQSNNCNYWKHVHAYTFI